MWNKLTWIIQITQVNLNYYHIGKSYCKENQRYSQRRRAWVDFLSHHVCQPQDIPVFYE